MCHCIDLTVAALLSVFVQPVTLRSPQTVLQSQRGSSLEYTSLLCSLLLGLNYNAYCVSGYASRQLCELDRTQEDPPLLDKPEKVNHSL